MKLTELEAKFIKATGEGSWTIVESLGDADGIQLLCPLCWQTNNGPVGTHSILCWFEGKVPDDRQPGPGRWTPQGSNLHDLTFVDGPKSRSVLLTGGCAWHGFITNGETSNA